MTSPRLQQDQRDDSSNYKTFARKTNPNQFHIISRSTLSKAKKKKKEKKKIKKPPRPGLLFIIFDDMSFAV